MSALSNSFPRHDAAGIECRPVQRGEIEPAMRLILATESGLAGDEQVLDFLSFCLERKIDTNGTWIAIHDGRIVWSMLPSISPGKTMLIFTPLVQFTQTPQAAIGELADALCQHHAQRGVQLCQMLIDPAAGNILNLYRDAGFTELAELVYLQKAVRKSRTDLPMFPGSFSLKEYSPQTHGEFARAIQSSYQQSMDCPALNGMREIDDVITGHQATGEFDPRLWWVLSESDSPRAVLLLSRVTNGSALELVYLGLTPEARGRGIGDLLMQQALASAARDGRENLSLAVDSRNQPALRLYFRHGLRRIGSRVALVRDMRVQSSGFGVQETQKRSHSEPALEPHPEP
jgi:ribosomal protein S18 acetylase RimI-like enzyme